MDVKAILLLLVSSVLVNNFVMARFLGCCPFLGVSKQVGTAMGMGVAVTFVMGLASLITYIVYYAVLVPMHLMYLKTMAFILVIAVLVQLVEMIILKMSPSLYKALGVYLPLITTNCAVLGVALLNINEGYNLVQTVISGVGGGLGFTLAIVLFAGVRERMASAPIPSYMKGFPIALVSAGLMSIAFLGFSGLIK